VIPVNKNKKPLMRKWKQYQQKRPSEGELKSWFRRNGVTGLAVMCGPVSGSLVVRDFDDESAYEDWRSAHRDLAAVLPTVRTDRGYHVYFTDSTDHIIGLTDGELRGAGYVLLPPSRHPTGRTYRWVVPLSNDSPPVLDPVKTGLLPAATASLNESRATPPCVGSDLMQQSRQRHTEHTEDIVVETAIRNEADYPVELDAPIEQAIQDTLPKGVRQRNHAIFEFCRVLKAIPHLADPDPQNLRSIVQEWHRRAKPVIRTKAFEETWIDFLQGWPKVRFPKGTGPMDVALDRAKAAQPPPEALSYEQPALRRLVGLCRELQRGAGDGVFFLACRTAGRLLGVNYSTAWRWLSLLESDRLLCVVERGQPGVYRATRFKYRGS
jgi:hypothetical protein